MPNGEFTAEQKKLISEIVRADHQEPEMRVFVAVEVGRGVYLLHLGLPGYFATSERELQPLKNAGLLGEFHTLPGDLPVRYFSVTDAGRRYFHQLEQE